METFMATHCTAMALDTTMAAHTDMAVHGSSMKKPVAVLIAWDRWTDCDQLAVCSEQFNIIHVRAASSAVSGTHIRMYVVASAGPS